MAKTYSSVFFIWYVNVIFPQLKDYFSSPTKIVFSSGEKDVIADSNATDVKHEVSDIKLSRLEGKWKTMDLKGTT